MYIIRIFITVSSCILIDEYFYAVIFHNNLLSGCSITYLVIKVLSFFALSSDRQIICLNIGNSFHIFVEFILSVQVNWSPGVLPETKLGDGNVGTQ